MSRLISGAEIIYQNLLKHKVKDVFMYSGGSIMPLIDKFYDSPINRYVNSHEQNCGHAATGYAKSSGQTGIAIVTSGPGITNMITPMLDATNDSTPLIVLSGQVNQKFIGTNAFQEAPATELSKHVTKWSHMVTDIKHLDEVMDKAFYIANNDKKGAVHIDLPKCITTQDVEESELSSYKPINCNYNFDELYEYTGVMKLINNSSKPILYVGQGCNNDYEELRKFAIDGNIPVTTTIHACGVFDEDHPLSLGWCGMHGYPAANYALQEADCIIAMGSRFDDRTTGALEKYAPVARSKNGIVHVNIEMSEINKVINSHYNFAMPCADFLRNTVPHVVFRPRQEWITKLNTSKEKHKFSNPKESGYLYMENVLTQIYQKTKHLNDDLIITTGVGNHQMQTYQYIKSHYPKKIFSSGSLGVMGAGLPYAVGAQIANPDKTVICIDGDSSFNMTLTDMKTIVENDLPIKIAIMNNSGQMMVTIWEELFFNARYTATLNERNPDFALLAEAYGLKSLKCNTIEDLEDCVDEFLTFPGPILCEFKIEKGICLPLVSPGCSLSEMILPKNYNYKQKNKTTNMKLKDVPS